jgi:anti-sigma regulatory factor (Ser/Thr protein kinase)
MLLEHIVRMRNRPHDLPALLNGVQEFCEARGLAKGSALDVRLLAEEVLTNVIKYAYKEIEERWIELRLFASAESVRLEFRDEGAPFNPLDVPVPDLATRREDREIGGRGLHLVRSLVDDASYSREGSVNVLVLVKHFGFTISRNSIVTSTRCSAKSSTARSQRRRCRSSMPDPPRNRWAAQLAPLASCRL